jgi:hypothetical protein
MTEDFLIYIWRYQLYGPDLQTSEGQKIIVKNPGIRNTDAGPDFHNAMVRIGTTLWAGNIEVHVKSSDWLAHQHQHDDAYSNIILHVVYEHDMTIIDRNELPIPTIELKDKIDEERFAKYQYFINNKNWVPCSKEISLVDPITKTSWLERMLVERLERKTEVVGQVLSRNKNNWEESFYQVLAGNFGFRVNEQPFRMLATMTPLNILQKHRNNPMQIEAILMGQAGLLHQEFTDEYPKQLKNEYHFLRQKYGLVPMEGHLWKFMRLRPANFPTIRISQFSDLIGKQGNLFSRVIACSNVDELLSIYDIYASDYWRDHYNFDVLSPASSKKFGVIAGRILIINTIVQFMYLYGTIREKQKYRDRAIKFLLDLPAEKNKIIRGWENLSIKAENALESQALLELKNKYCDLKKCLHCSIGLKLLNISK